MIAEGDVIWAALPLWTRMQSVLHPQREGLHPMTKSEAIANQGHAKDSQVHYLLKVSIFSVL